MVLSPSFSFNLFPPPLSVYLSISRSHCLISPIPTAFHFLSPFPPSSPTDPNELVTSHGQCRLQNFPKRPTPLLHISLPPLRPHSPYLPNTPSTTFPQPFFKSKISFSLLLILKIPTISHLLSLSLSLSLFHSFSLFFKSLLDFSLNLR